MSEPHGPRSTSRAHGPAGAQQRARRVQCLVEECLCRRTAGEAISDEQMCAAHPELLPELAEALRGLAVIERARDVRPESSGRRSERPADLPADAFEGYALLGELHRGGQGIVYRAEQRSTGRKVALKVLRDGAFAGKLDRARFEREVQVLAALKHPNIVTIYDSGCAAGHFYFVMDYIPGRPLDVYMSSAPHSVAQTLALFGKVCDAINAAHVRGIIHRDLKPANILVDPAGQPHILDFGLAKLAEPQTGSTAGPGRAMTLTGEFVGSLPWAAPEQVEGGSGRIDTRTDVYALGVLLYEMLTGRFPYPVAGPMHEVVPHILHDAPRAPRKLRPDIDDELATVLLKCLAKAQERRYQTAGELGRDLQRYLRHEPVEAKGDSAWYMLRKSVRRFRAVLAVAAAFVLLLAGSSALAWMLWVQARESADAARLRLRDALVAQARSTRLGRQVGQRFQALDALRQAAALGPTAAARNEAIAAMALPDLRAIRSLPDRGFGYFDRPLERCAVLRSDGSIVVLRIADEQVVAELPAPAGGFVNIHWATLEGQNFTRLFDTPTGGRHLEVWSLPEQRMQWALRDAAERTRYDISRDGTRLAVGRLDRAIHVYELQSGRETERVAVDRSPAYMTFDPSGRRLALYHADYAQARILDLETGTLEPAFESTKLAWAVAWHPSGTLLAGASETQIELWDTQQRCRRGVLAGHEAHVVHLRFSDDGELLLSNSWDGQSCLWDVRSQRLLLKLNLSGPVFGPDGDRVAGTLTERGANHVTVFELNRAAECRQIASSQPAWLVLAVGVFDPVSGLLLSAEGATAEGSGGIRVYDVERGCEEARLVSPNVWSIAVDPGGDFFLAGHDDGVYRWPLRRTDGRLVIGPAQRLFVGARVTALGLSADGTTASLGGYSESEFAVLDLHSPARVRRFGCAMGRKVLALSPDARWAATSAAASASAEIWDVQRAVRLAELPFTCPEWVSFRADGEFLVSGSSGGLRLWEFGTWRLVRPVAGDFGAGVSYGRPGSIASTASGGNAVRLLNADTYEDVAILEPPDRYASTDFDFSPDGARLVQLTNRAGVIHVWDLRLIRSELARMGLDWSTAPRDFGPVSWRERPSVEFDLSSSAP